MDDPSAWWAGLCHVQPTTYLYQSAWDSWLRRHNYWHSSDWWIGYNGAKIYLKSPNNLNIQAPLRFLNLWFLEISNSVGLSKFESENWEKIWDAKYTNKKAVKSYVRAVGRSENPWVPVVFSGHNLPPLVEIELTDLPKSGGAMAPPDFGRSVKPISAKGLQIIPTN